MRTFADISSVASVSESLSPPEQDGRVQVTPDTENTVAGIYRTLSGNSETTDIPETFSESLKSYLQHDQQERSQPLPLSVCFKSVTTYGRAGRAAPAKTLKDAIWRTLTFQDVYEWTFKRAIYPVNPKDGRDLIRDFSGVVKNGEMMLVLGNPGSGCSTFLRTIGNDHKSFLGVEGSISYSGISCKDISQRFRGLVTYIPEDDLHLPTLTVRQTIEFALKNKIPRKWQHRIHHFIEEFGKAFGMTHVMDVLVGNEYIRGVSGGERKRVSILEFLASDASVNAWDGSTRGLDASSALDFIRSLRIMTDSCQRATLVSLYQASDDIYKLMDKLLLIDQGRMLYNGPAREAERYFNNLGYQRLPRQTMSDFLTSVARGDAANIARADKASVPRGALNLEKAFRSSLAFAKVHEEIAEFEKQFLPSTEQNPVSRSRGVQAKHSDIWKEIEQDKKNQKSKFVSSKSVYRTALLRQILLCAQREYWQLKGHKTAFVFKMVCVIVCAFLLSSMFYDMPDDTRGVYSRGGFIFYSTAIVAWFQMSELETAFRDRVVVSRHKRYGMVRPSAVVCGKALLDVPVLLVLASLYSCIAYFLSGMRLEVGSFFLFFSSVFFAALAFTMAFRVFSAVSPSLEVAFRYAGVYLQLGVACGGYIRSLDRLITDVPWVGWLAYLTPVPYTFELLMSSEFHNRNFPCDADSVIPVGSGYNDSAYQGCLSRGATSKLGIDGDEYLSNELGFSYHNVARNYGILIVFISGFLFLNMWLVEKLDWAKHSGAIHEYAGNHVSKTTCRKTDEENTGNHVGENVIDDNPVLSSGKTEESKHSRATFTWHNLNYSVHHGHGEKQLLKDVSGFCESGKLTALVGPSGAGKSTLLTALTQQASGNLSGEMTVDGSPVGSSFGRTIGYCQQMDIHIETSTVREAFEFSALLRQDPAVDKGKKLSYVDEVLEILGMVELQHVVIRSLSLEQKKRTTIGVELCAKPNLLLFLDEPTSGLDSQGAMNIVKLLRKLAEDGQAIVCTIHQASQEQFDMFDRVLAINHGGRVYYFGDVSSVVPYFSKHGVLVDAEKNIADLIIEVTSQKSSGETSVDWSDTWAESQEAAIVIESIKNVVSSKGAAKDTLNTEEDGSYNREFASDTTQQIVLLTQRTFKQYWRAPDYIYSRLYASFIHAGLNGLIFLQVDNTVSGMQYRVFSCFLVLMLVPEFINACAVMFDENRNVFLGREYPSRIYGHIAFSTANIVAEIPYALLGAVLFYVLFYFLVGFPLGVPAVYTFLMVILFHLFTTSWGQWIAAFSSDAGMASSIMPFFVIICELFNGVLQPRELMPAFWRYTAYYIGPFTYWISGIVAMILPRLAVRCSEDELTRFEPPSDTTCGAYASTWLEGTGGYLSNPEATENCGYCQYASGEEYLSTLAISASDAWPYFGIFVLFTVSNFGFVYLLVYVKSVKNWLPW